MLLAVSHRWSSKFKDMQANWWLRSTKGLETWALIVIVCLYMTALWWTGDLSRMPAALQKSSSVNSVFWWVTGRDKNTETADKTMTNQNGLTISTFQKKYKSTRVNRNTATRLSLNDTSKVGGHTGTSFLPWPILDHLLASMLLMTALWTMWRLFGGTEIII